MGCTWCCCSGGKQQLEQQQQEEQQQQTFTRGAWCCGSPTLCLWCCCFGRGGGSRDEPRNDKQHTVTIELASTSSPSSSKNKKKKTNKSILMKSASIAGHLATMSPEPADNSEDSSLEPPTTITTSRSARDLPQQQHEKVLMTARSATEMPTERAERPTNPLLEICGDFNQPAQSLLEASARRLVQHQQRNKQLVAALGGASGLGGGSERTNTAKATAEKSEAIRKLMLSKSLSDRPALKNDEDILSSINTQTAQTFVNYFLQALQLGDITWALGYDVGLLFATNVTLQAPDGMRYTGKAAVVKRLNNGVERLLKFTGPRATCAKPSTDEDADVDVKDVDKLREKFEVNGPTMTRADGAEWGPHRGTWVVTFTYKFKVNRMLSYAFEDRFAMRGKNIAAIVRKRLK